MTDSIKTRIKACLDAVHDAEKTYARTPQSVRVLAVSKNQSAEAIQTAFHTGIHDFGESYWQEAKNKQLHLQNLPITWHFIGPIQSNKAKYIAKNFSWVHSVCRTEIAELLNKHRLASQPKLNICIQVNLDTEASKSGCALDALLPLATHILSYPNLNLRGLMAIPKKNTNLDTCYQTFLKLKNAQDILNQQLNLSLDTLSMGMSDDFMPAIRAGTTWIRIGRGIFG
ncbi:MAG: YggS family pyridoxal phosphate-dependent enzyme [Legionella sp.]|nr:YggS family pyridoxal phosphate-dependent enzyme [Legionella sp.]